ncbi:alpha/beta fold hydrolase [Piscicoccus intestinalis]|uniref:alpha/beta fold hydrolase n=1 Tax=Piscicoccus intestinalis TaxID=746033 RepID=UPI000839A756|nr:alpha/beta hydrolase [Piscicoccus intestinalis]
MSNTDTGAVLVPGDWRHRFVTTNGTRLHIAEAGEGPLVLLLHGYPQFWWAWRHQLPLVAGAGFRAVAVDLRGFGASDKPPIGYDPATLAADIAGLVRSLGEADAVVVGHGLGGWLAWALPRLHPGVIRAVGAFGMAHPALLGVRALPWQLAHPSWRLPARHLLGTRIGARALSRSRAMEAVLRRGAAPASRWPGSEEIRRYGQAMAMPFAARSGADAHRSLSRAALHPDGRRLLREVNRTVYVPVLHVHGEKDRLISPGLARRSVGYVRPGPYEWHLLAGVGHFVPEEAPVTTGRLLVDWLTRLP